MFLFSLQRILDYRRQMREKVENEMRAVRKRIRAEQTNLEFRRRELDSCAYSLRDLREAEDATAYEISLIYRYMDGLKEHILGHEQAIERLNDEMEEKRKKLVAASQQEKVMEKLKENEWKAYLEMSAKKENAFLDEIAIRNHRYAESE